MHKTRLVHMHMECESKKKPPPKKKPFFNIFTQAKYISMTFCQFVASLYPHTFTDFGLFILIFNKMTLSFLEVLIVFTASSFEFQ